VQYKQTLTKKHFFFFFSLRCLCAALAAVSIPAGDLALGEKLFQSRCTQCHTIKEVRLRSLSFFFFIFFGWRLLTLCALARVAAASKGCAQQHWTESLQHCRPRVRLD
jgi:hypothetical protein